MEVARRVRERNKDHFTEEVKFEADAQGNVRATIENMTMVFLKNKHMYLRKMNLWIRNNMPYTDDYKLPWLNSDHAT